MQKFSEFMQEWLYGENGYYRTLRVGKKGDFYTSVSVSAFFGYSIANYLLEFLQNYTNKHLAIVEIGAEKGNLISDVAFYLQHKTGLKNVEFATLEPLLELHTTQKETFSNVCKGPNLRVFQNFKELKEEKFDFIIYLSNELLDAFACELYYKGKMAFVEDFTLQFLPKENLDSNFIGEIPVGACEFVKELESCAKEWLFITFDYGSKQKRGEFSLRFYKEHSTQNLFKNEKEQNFDLKENFGKWDITYDVDFSLWEEEFKKAGAKELFFGRQNRILVDFGLDKVGEWYIHTFGLESFMHHSSKIRTLIDPALLGERFFGIGFLKSIK
ncbi:SAM-dependent methyltransferase [Helicobacter burdigaliensis]|uniref:SAM-dependent methyltransferase n=1 Tax=Helicobacter burdigaliensis TaxID=2315334 RepID=UPI000EF64FE0|nr:SAM-dependent methyltransferase [Helicobacter burdigaliensis]